jgi:hypothetical protein
MANGTAALKTLDPPSAPEQRLAPDKPAIELEILGQAVADATCALAAGMTSYYWQDGILDPWTRKPEERGSPPSPCWRSTTQAPMPIFCKWPAMPVTACCVAAISPTTAMPRSRPMWRSAFASMDYLRS